jgi:AraC-like DNA-binding protein
MNFKICDVASMLGINDPSQFSRLLKEFYGISSKKYQMIHSTSGMVNGSDWPRPSNTNS